MRMEKKTTARKAKSQALGPGLQEESAVANEVGAYEARTHFSALLARVQKGERVTITKHGVPIAELVPAAVGVQRAVAGAPTMSVEEAIAKLKEFRKGVRLDGLTIRELREEGRE
jgi:prevent-host-death family protein